MQSLPTDEWEQEQKLFLKHVPSVNSRRRYVYLQALHMLFVQEISVRKCLISMCIDPLGGCVLVLNATAMIPGTTSSPSRKIRRIVLLQESHRRFCALEHFNFTTLLYHASHVTLAFAAQVEDKNAQIRSSRPPGTHDRHKRVQSSQEKRMHAHPVESLALP